MKHEIIEALEHIQEAINVGGIPLCGKCRRPGEFAIYCDGGKFHAVSCESCWAAHLDYIEAARIFQASGLAYGAMCSRCGGEDFDNNHVHAKGIYA